MTSTQHSQLPWKAEVVGSGGDYDNPIDVCEITNGYRRIAEYMNAVDARFVVTAVNSHAQLTSDLAEAVEALRQAESAMTYTQATVAPGNHGRVTDGWVEVHRGRADSSYAQLYGAIERARPILSKHSKEQQK